jgi:uncharacterized protein (TIGR02996 family)
VNADALLAALRDQPDDDLSRLAYADWLEEHGDERAAYLRAEQRLAELTEFDPDFAELEKEVGEKSHALDPDWLALAGRCWDVWLVRYHPTVKISVIKALREITGCGLVEGKNLSEATPCAVASGCTRSQAETARDYLMACYSSEPPEPPHVTVVIRPCADPAARAVLPPTAPTFDVILRGCQPGREEELTAALHNLETPGYSVRTYVETRKPRRLRSCATVEEARQVARLLDASALVEVRRFARFPIPPTQPMRRLLLGSGPHEVWLAGYASGQKVDVIRAYREATGCDLLAAKRWAEQEPPLLIAREVDAHSADALRSRFGGFGGVEVEPPPRLVLGAGGHDVYLLEVRPEHKIEAMTAYREATGADGGQAVKWAEQQPPLLIVKGVDREGIFRLRQRFGGLGRVEIEPPPRLTGLAEGAYDVWLIEAPCRDATGALVGAYREATGATLAQALAWAGQAPPLLIVKGVDRRSVDLLRQRFASLGKLQVRTLPAT